MPWNYYQQKDTNQRTTKKSLILRYYRQIISGKLTSDGDRHYDICVNKFNQNVIHIWMKFIFTNHLADIPV